MKAIAVIPGKPDRSPSCQILGPLSIPVILGTTRKGRMSAHVARFVAGEIAKHRGVETELIDIAQLPLPVDDAGGGVKDDGFAAKMNHADALVIVTPEYKHSFPGLLKHILDSNLKEYVHKAVRPRWRVGRPVWRHPGYRALLAGTS